MTYLNPWFSAPMRLPTGTLTFSKVMKLVPLAHTPMQSMRRQITPGMVFSMSNKEIPPMPDPPVRTATVK
jgi:hypothetical protein